jgi:exopolyphosphatase/guanosine-5'-triphosphate,3'-diphosphate pyrophosphatase
MGTSYDTGGAMKAAAVIDIGSNTIKLLIAEIGKGQVESIAQKSYDARLGGEYQDGQPWLEPSRRRVALEVVEKLLEFSKQWDPAKVALVATSAVREATNRTDFAAEIKSATGHCLRILSEEEEARYIAYGIAQDPGLPDPGNFTAFDLGGGSMERTVVEGGRLVTAQSFRLGAVRLTRELCENNGKEALRKAEIDAIRDKVRDTLPDCGTLPCLVGSGGAFTITRTILLSRLPGNGDLEQQRLLASPDYKTLPIECLRSFTEEISLLPLEARAAIPHLPMGRADILPTALHIILGTADKYGASSWQPTQFNLRHGVAKELLESN